MNKYYTMNKYVTMSGIITISRLLQIYNLWDLMIPLLTVPAIDIALTLQDEVLSGYIPYACSRQLSSAWIIDEKTGRLQCRVFGTDEGYDYGRSFGLYCGELVQYDPIYAFEKYGYALELRVGHHAPMWNYHYHAGHTDYLEPLFSLKPFVELSDETMVETWNKVYNKLRNFPHNQPAALSIAHGEHFSGTIRKGHGEDYKP